MASAKSATRGSKRQPLSAAAILKQIPAARRREEMERKAGLRAVSVSYDFANDRVVLELSNGVSFAFPVDTVVGLADASLDQRAAMELSPSGSGVLWPELNTDVSVPGLIADAFGARAIGRALGSAGGRAKTETKAAAARLNGAKGGRPRKKPRIVKVGKGRPVRA